MQLKVKREQAMAKQKAYDDVYKSERTASRIDAQPLLVCHGDGQTDRGGQAGISMDDNLEMTLCPVVRAGSRWKEAECRSVIVSLNTRA